MNALWPGDKTRQPMYAPQIPPVAAFIYKGMIIKRRTPPFMWHRPLREVSLNQIDTRYAGKWLIDAMYVTLKTGKPHYMLRDGDVFMVTP